MDARIRSSHYFNLTVKDEPGETCRLLAHLASEGVNLLAFNAIPLGPAQTQFILFPESVERFEKAAALLGVLLSEPQHALLVQGDDRLGALLEIHERLYVPGRACLAEVAGPAWPRWLADSAG